MPKYILTNNVRQVVQFVYCLPFKAYWLTDTPTDLTFNKTDNVRIKKYWGAFVQPLLQWNSYKYYIFRVCGCSLRYSAWNAHALYCHLWPLQLYYIFPHFLINGTIFKKMLLKKSVLVFSTTSVWNISHSQKNWARYDQEYILAFM